MPVFKPSLSTAEVCFTEIKMYISRRPSSGERQICLNKFTSQTSDSSMIQAETFLSSSFMFFYSSDTTLKKFFQAILNAKCQAEDNFLRHWELPVLHTTERHRTVGKSCSAVPRWIRNSHFSEYSAFPLTVLTSLS